MSERELLGRTAEIAADFLETLEERPIWPPASVEELRAALGGELPDGPVDPLDVIEALAAASEPGVVAIPSGRYFGFVIGGALPAALAADWLTSTWDQNSGLVDRRARPRRSRRRRPGTGSSSSSGCRRARRSPSSPAARWHT